MKTFKKVLGVVLAIAMLAGVFSMMASALAPDTAVDLYISTDKTAYAAGDVVTLTFSEQADALIGNMQLGGQYAIGYNSAVLEPYTTSTKIADHNFVAIQAGSNSGLLGISPVIFNDAIDEQGAGLDATQAATYGWDKSICFGVADDGTSFDATTAPVDLFTVQMKIKADAPDGTYTIGFSQGAYAGYLAYSNDTNGGVYGDDDDMGYGVTKTFGYGTCTFTVGATGPAVYYQKTQLKKNLTMGGETYDVALRIISYITDSDFDTYFANTKQVGVANSETTNKITAVGIVAFDGTATDFNAATAASVVAGTTVDGYKYAETDYIQKADDSADATFGAIIRGERAAFENKPVTFMGYVKYLDDAGTEQVIFYEAAVEKTVTTAMLG